MERISADKPWLFLVALGVSGNICYNLTISLGAVAGQGTAFATASFHAWVYACVLALMLAASFAASTNKRRQVLIRIDTACAIIWGILHLGSFIWQLEGIPSNAFLATYNLLSVWLSIEIFLRWNLAMVLCPVRKVTAVVVVAVLFALAYCALMLCLPERASSLLVAVVPAVSFIILGEIDYHAIGGVGTQFSLAEVKRQDAQYPTSLQGLRRNRMLFFVSRALWGIVFALLINARDVEAATRESTALTEFVLVICIVLLFLIVGNYGMERPISSLWIAALPIVSAVGLYLTFSDESLRVHPAVFAMISWLAWRIQSYIQLPTYRQLLQMDPDTFATVSRAASAVPYAIARLALVYLAVSSPTAAPATAGSLDVTVAITIALTLATSVFIFRHVRRYFPTPVSDHPSTDRIETEPQPFAPPDDSDVLDRFDLTGREKEVLKYLVDGYSRPYIEKAMGISTGTAKSHTYHIYQKLDVRSQDELIDLVKGLKPLLHFDGCRQST